LADIEEAVYAITTTVNKYKNLWKLMDLRTLADQNLEEISDQFVEVADAIVTLSEVCTMLVKYRFDRRSNQLTDRPTD
jgi:hypothetical protein